MDKWYLDFQVLGRPIYAVGFDLVDAAEGGAALFANENGETATIASCCRSSGSVLFFGFISDTPFSRFTLINTAHGDGWAIDQVVLAPPQAPDPGTLLQQLLADVTGVGPGKSLADKVRLAQTYYAVPDIQATCAMLTDFVREIRAQRGKKIPVEVADDLASDAQSIMTAIGCE
jgi:hypothetical protein